MLGSGKLSAKLTVFGHEYGEDRGDQGDAADAQGKGDRLNAGNAIYGLGQFYETWTLDCLIDIQLQTAHVH